MSWFTLAIIQSTEMGCYELENIWKVWWDRVECVQQTGLGSSYLPTS